MVTQNPYSPPPSTQPEVECELDSPPLFLRGRPILTFVVATGVVAVLNLLEFMVVDWCTVRVWPYPDEDHEREWLMLFMPVLPVFALAVIVQLRLLSLRAVWVYTAGSLGFLCAIPLCATVGVWFHFAIGGRL
jgi:hypothetical protein